MFPQRFSLWPSEANSLCFFILVHANAGQSQNTRYASQTHHLFYFIAQRKQLLTVFFCFSSVLYLEGSVLVFEDIFKLVAFYCVSRWVGFIASMEGSFTLPSGVPFASIQSQHSPLCFFSSPLSCQMRRYFRCWYLQQGQITQFLARHTITTDVPGAAVFVWEGSIVLHPQRTEAQDWG